MEENTTAVVEETNDEVVIETPTPKVVEETKPLTKNEMLKQMSVEYGFNAFDPKTVKAEFDELKAFKEAQKEKEDANKTELEKYQEKVTELENEKLSFLEKTQKLEAITKLQSKNVSKEHIEDVIDLLKIRGLEANDENINKLLEKNKGWISVSREITKMGVKQTQETKNQLDEQTASKYRAVMGLK